MIKRTSKTENCVFCLLFYFPLFVFLLLVKYCILSPIQIILMVQSDDGSAKNSCTHYAVITCDVSQVDVASF